jgi:histidinol-phosphate aminotransferase
MPTSSLVKTTNANRYLQLPGRKGIIVRNRTNVELCEGCLRITVGTPDENTTLLQTLQNFK